MARPRKTVPASADAPAVLAPATPADPWAAFITDKTVARADNWARVKEPKPVTPTIQRVIETAQEGRFCIDVQDMDADTVTALVREIKAGAHLLPAGHKLRIERGQQNNRAALRIGVTTPTE